MKECNGSFQLCTRNVFSKYLTDLELISRVGLIDILADSWVNTVTNYFFINKQIILHWNEAG